MRSIPGQLGRGALLEIVSGWRSLGAGTSMFHVKRSRPGAIHPRRYAASMRQAVRETPIHVEPPMTLGPRHDPSACAPLVLTPPPHITFCGLHTRTAIHVCRSGRHTPVRRCAFHAG